MMRSHRGGHEFAGPLRFAACHSLRYAGIDSGAPDPFVEHLWHAANSGRDSGGDDASLQEAAGHPRSVVEVCGDDHPRALFGSVVRAVLTSRYPSIAINLIRLPANH